MDETWIEYTEEEMHEFDSWEHDDVEHYSNGRKSLQLWSGQQLQTTPCQNQGAVIELFFVPFIVVNYDDKGSPAATESDEDDEEL